MVNDDSEEYVEVVDVGIQAGAMGPPAPQMPLMVKAATTAVVDQIDEAMQTEELVLPTRAITVTSCTTKLAWENKAGRGEMVSFVNFGAVKRHAAACADLESLKSINTILNVGSSASGQIPAPMHECYECHGPPRGLGRRRRQASSRGSPAHHSSGG